MPFRQPIVQRGRQQKHLIQIAVAKSFAQEPILQDLPRLSTRKPDLSARNCKYSLPSGGIYLRQTPSEFEGGGRPSHGPKEVRAYLTQSRAGWIEGRSEPEQFLPAGDKVVVFVHARFRPKGNPSDWTEVRLADVYTFRGDVIVAMHAFANRRDALKYAGIDGVY